MNECKPLQTGSGKTHTMEGSPGDAGLIGRTVHALFQRLHTGVPAGSRVSSVTVSALEIYNEAIRDLFSSTVKAARVGALGGIMGGGKAAAAGKLEVREEAQADSDGGGGAGGAAGGGYVRVGAYTRPPLSSIPEPFLLPKPPNIPTRSAKVGLRSGRM